MACSKYDRKADTCDGCERLLLHRVKRGFKQDAWRDRVVAWLDRFDVMGTPLQAAHYQPPPAAAVAYPPMQWAIPPTSEYVRPSANSDTSSIKSLALGPPGPFIGTSEPPSAAVSDDEARDALPYPVRVTSTGSAGGGRCSSLPPPSLPHRPYRRRTQEARDMVALKSLLPGLYPEGRSVDHSTHRPNIEHTSSYVQDDNDAPSPASSSDSDTSSAALAWQTPHTDHPLTAAESADILERVQSDLLGMDITKLKGPLAEIARKYDPERTPRASVTPNAFRTSPKYSRTGSESFTVSPKEAFLDYDAVSATKLGGSVSPQAIARRDGRLSSPMPSLFAPLVGPMNAAAIHSPLRTSTSIKSGSLSPPFGHVPTSASLVRGASNPSPTHSRAMHPTRYSLEPEAAPRNAVRWISTKREPVDDGPGMADENDGDFDWSPSSEEGEGGLALENPPTPPPPSLVAASRAINAKTDAGLPFSLDTHPLSADLAYISPLPTPAFAAPTPLSHMSAEAARPSLPQRTSRERWTPAHGTPAESAERSTCEDDDGDDDDGRAAKEGSSSEEWTPAFETRVRRPMGTSHAAATTTTSSRAFGADLSAPPTPVTVTPAKRQRHAPVRDDYTEDDDEDEDEADLVDDSSEEVSTPVAKARKLGKHGGEGKRAPPRQRTAARNAPVGEGSILCDWVDPETGVVCNTPFRRPYDLARHKETKHTDRANKPTWLCDTCGSSFSRRDALMRHARLRQHKMPGA